MARERDYRSPEEKRRTTHTNADLVPVEGAEETYRESHTTAIGNEQNNKEVVSQKHSYILHAT